MKQKRCELCGELFTPTSGRQKCCNKPVKRICTICGEEFDSICARNVNTCCDKPECKRAAKYTHGKRHIKDKKCKNCGELFTPTGTSQLYCFQSKVKKCVICGKEFTYICGKYEPDTCSDVCQGMLAKQVRKQNLSKVTKICEWCGKEFTPIDSLQKYCEGPHYQKCVICGKEFEIELNTSNYLRKTCSKECENILNKQNHNYTACSEAHKKSLLSKYGVSNSMRIPGVIDKIKKVNLERYGAEWYTQTDEYKRRVKETSQKKYGVDHYLKSEEVIQKRQQTVKDKYNVNNVFQNDRIKEKTKQTLLEKYGVEYVSQNPDIRAKALRNAKQSGLEYRICSLFDNYGFEYIHHYVIQKDGHSHEFDFYLPQLKLLIDADGLYYHSYLDDPDGQRIRDDYDEVRLYLVPDDHIFQVIVEGSEEVQIKQLVSTIEKCAGSLADYDSIVFEWCRSIKFPYPDYSEKRLRNDWKHLKSYNNDTFIPQCRIGQSLIKQFHKSIYHCHVGNNLSPFEGWNDDSKLRQVIRNRLIYINRIDPSKVLAGFNISKICPMVSTFNPVLARYLTLKYLNEFDDVFDPFSGFSGRLLGVTSTGRSYTGQDLNHTAVVESNRIINFLQLDTTKYKVTEQNILESYGNYSCLLTCPPYNKKEKYAYETVFKNCDEWIHECLTRFKCKKYVFVVDETADFEDQVVEEVRSSSHFSKIVEKVVVIRS